MDGKVSIRRQSWQFSSVNNVIEVLFPICILNRRVNNVFRQGKSIYRRKKVLLILNKIVAFPVLYTSFPSLTVSYY